MPEQGNLVRVRDRYWVVESVRQSSRPVDPMSSNGWTRHHLVTLVPIDDKGSPSPLSVFWETEPGTEIRPQSELPDPAEGLDAPEVFAGFLDAVRWGAIASADPQAFQSPFRAGIDIEDYQLLPLVKALRMPRVTLLVADDVGLGKTVEAGLIAQELVLRNQANKILVVCPPSLCGKWQREMREQFGLSFQVVDTDHVRRLRRERGVGVNPFRSHPRLIVSMEWVKFESQMRWFDEFLPPDPNVFPQGVRSVDRGRGPPHRAVRGGALRPGFAADQGDEAPGAAFRASAVLDGDAPQRVSRVVPGAVGDAGPEPVHQGRGSPGRETAKR